MPSQDYPQQGASQLRGDIAIVGMSCLLPGAKNLESYWHNIISKVDAISDPPADAWDPAVFYDPDANTNDRTYCKRGGYIGDIARFRPADFGVMPVNVEGGEPDQWLALQLAYDALADAGYPESITEHLRTEVILGKGTYINRGNMTVGYHGLIVEQVLDVLKNLGRDYSAADLAKIKQELKANLPPFSADTAPALIGNIIVGRIANRLDLMGPSFTVDAACASALLAIEVGVTNLLSGKCDLVLAGGANVNTPLPTLILFCQLGALSHNEQIRPFDKNADGTLLGEGLGFAVLKRLADAERDGDRIYAVIKGVGSASDGRGQHVMAPRVEGEEAALRRAYEMAGVSPQSIGLIEAHGTATPVGDAVEIRALSSVFGERQSALPSCALGSVKSMIGHTMPAAGIAGLIKTALALYHRVLPPTINCTEPDPEFALQRTPFYINTEMRPWIHGGPEPRRAGVNAFGFGGINGHVVLEEYVSDEVEQHSHLLAWDTEVCVFSGSSRETLIEQGQRFKNYVEGADVAPLKDLAYTLNTQLQEGSHRLAIVASSSADLAQKLEHALERLSDPGCRQIKDNKGIYFFEEPLSRQGKLAMMFPGEGAQYPNMLLDLCVHFPEVRNCFDLADSAFVNHPRGYLPSDFIFPRALAEERERADMKQRLWQIDGAVESVLIANRAMCALLTQLALRPDVIVGHSTGDYSAMFAAGVIQFADEESYIQTIHAWNDVHYRLAKDLSLPEVALVAVGADPATIQSIVAAVGADIFVAMDNCPHQSVIVGEKAAVDRAVEALRRNGLMFEQLPFDRPYHTPLFRDYAQGVRRDFFSKLPISAPTTPVYSCTTADLYPDDRPAIEALFVDFWVEPVRFRDTIEKMYEDGVRVFIEAGPRGNLTAFVDDILRGSPHLAVSSNLQNRSGVTQLNHLVGILAAQGIDLNIAHLYARRRPQRIAWQEADTVTKASAAPVKLKLGMPHLKLASQPFKRVSPPLSEARAPAPDTVAAPQTASAVPIRRLAAANTAPEPAASAAQLSGVEHAQIMQQHLKGMENFLELQQQVMQGFFDRIGAGSTVAAGSLDSATSPQPYPLLGTITSFNAHHNLIVRRQLDRSEDTFLDEHALGEPVAITDPTLKPVIVVPLTMSMEILAEAAAALMPGQVVTGIRDVQAHHWIRVDDDPVTLHISAERRAEHMNEVEVRVHVLDNKLEREGLSQFPAIRGVVIVGDHYPEPPTAPRFELESERVSQLAAVDLYDQRLMFHGPCFQGVVAVERSGTNGAIAQLEVLPPNGLFRSVATPRFVTDPVLLDAVGQLVGFWAKEYLSQGFVVFPYRLHALHIYGPNRPARERLRCQLKLELLGSDRTRADFDIVGTDGKVWMRLEGWEDRRFDPPSRFHAFWVAPREAALSEPWSFPIEALAGKGALACYRTALSFDPPNPFWEELWSSLVLDRRERKAFEVLKGPALRRHDWLLGRTVAKDAVRAWLKKHHYQVLLATDIAIDHDQYGRPSAGGQWAASLLSPPSLSLSHSDGMAVAVVGDADAASKLGVDLERIRALPPEFEQVSFSSDEQRVYAAIPAAARTEWVLRLWCAKEALGKGLGRGLIEGPRSVRIIAIEPESGRVSAAVQGKLAQLVPEFAGSELIVYTNREADYVVAVTLCERKPYDND